MPLDSRRKSRRGRMMQLNSFDAQKLKEIGQKQAGKPRGFSIFWMRMIDRGRLPEKQEGKERNVKTRKD